ncbi:MAG: type II 3-dehydroquinate dehydratase [Balneolaceae bacterium]|nr:type II 3-dehydroquinate dehydratase [Balneolaceae bacterium]
MKILVLHGPNLNMLGTRNPEVYGSTTLEDLNENLKQRFENHEFHFFQSNVEGELINRIQSAISDGTEAIIANFGGYTHTSVAIRDALEPITLPKVEVHISNIHAREEFRKTSITGKVMHGIITGFGVHSYELGVQAVELLSTDFE